ncbi:MAG: maltose transporter, partial [Pseudomonadota bacterium]
MNTATLTLRRPAPANPWPARLGAAAATLAALYAVQVVHATGQTLLALTLLVISALAVWTYSSARTQALRYLFPGIATALVFVIFPMLYTMGMSFTNHSSRNLLEPERARAQLLETTLVTPGSQRGYGLHAAGTGNGAGTSAGSVRLHLDAGDTPGATPLVTAPFTLDADAPRALTLTLTPAPAAAEAALTGAALPMAERVRLLPALRALQLRTPDGSLLSLASLREFAQQPPLYEAQADGSLTDRLTRTVYRADTTEGFYTSAEGERLQPGFRVGVGLRHYLQIFSEGKFREPFASVFVWTVVFSGVTVISTCALGLLLAVLLEWP